MLMILCEVKHCFAVISNLKYFWGVWGGGEFLRCLSVKSHIYKILNYWVVMLFTLISFSCYWKCFMAIDTTMYQQKLTSINTSIPSVFSFKIMFLNPFTLVISTFFTKDQTFFLSMICIPIPKSQVKSWIWIIQKESW